LIDHEVILTVKERFWQGTSTASSSMAYYAAARPRLSPTMNRLLPWSLFVLKRVPSAQTHDTIDIM